MIGHVLRHLEELHNIVTESMIEEKRTPDHPHNSYTGQIKKQ